MKLSVIIPCFNEEKTIVEIINIVKKKINENDEIIVVDDHSVDSTPEIISKFAQKNDNIKSTSQVFKDS